MTLHEELVVEAVLLMHRNMYMEYFVHVGVYMIGRLTVHVCCRRWRRED